jgi:hypothetical protein
MTLDERRHRLHRCEQLPRQDCQSGRGCSDELSCPPLRAARLNGTSVEAVRTTSTVAAAGGATAAAENFGSIKAGVSVVSRRPTSAVPPEPPVAPTAFPSPPAPPAPVESAKAGVPPIIRKASATAHITLVNRAGAAGRHFACFRGTMLRAGPAASAPSRTAPASTVPDSTAPRRTLRARERIRPPDPRAAGRARRAMTPRQEAQRLRKSTDGASASSFTPHLRLSCNRAPACTAERDGCVAPVHAVRSHTSYGSKPKMPPIERNISAQPPRRNICASMITHLHLSTGLGTTAPECE